MKYLKDIKKFFGNKIEKISKEVKNEINYDFNYYLNIRIVSPVMGKVSEIPAGDLIHSKEKSLSNFKKIGFDYIACESGAISSKLMALKKYHGSELEYKLDSILQIARDFNSKIDYFYLVDPNTPALKARYRSAIQMSVSSECLKEIVEYLNLSIK